METTISSFHFLRLARAGVARPDLERGRGAAPS